MSGEYSSTLSAFAHAVERAKIDPLDAFVSVVDIDAVSADAEAQRAAEGGGPLAGVPYAVKDNIDTVALPTTANTPALKGSRRTTDHDAVTRLNEAGALMVGKTNLHELAFGITTNAAAYPATKNPFDPLRSPGGSSGGSGAAVGSGIVPFALATDTGGSATIPAAWCGVYGFRPSLSRWPSGRSAPLSSSRDTVGVIAATLDLVRAVDRVVRAEGVDDGTDAAAPNRIRIGVPKPDSRYLEPLGDDVRAVWERVIRDLEAADGIELVTVETDHLHELDEQCGIPIVLYETARDLTAYLAGLPEPVAFETVIEQAGAPDVQGVLGAAYEMREAHEQYADLMRARERLRGEWDELFRSQRIDVLLRPTTAISATLIGDDITTPAFGDEVPTFGTVTRNTGPGSTAGQPSLTIPAGIGPAGLPIGVSLDGQRDGDDAMLAIGARLDEVVGRVSGLLG